MANDKKNSLQEMRKSVSESTLGIFRKALSGEPLTDKERDTFMTEMYNNPERMVVIGENLGEASLDTFYSLLQSPAMIERANELRKAGRIQQGLESAVDAFNDAYNFYLASEQKRVGEEELAGISEARPPKPVEAIPELEDAIRQARKLGDPTAAISQLEQQIERANLGAIRAAQLGSRGQAGALGAQAQAIHQANLAQRGQIPMMGQQIKAQGLQAQIPLIAQKQAIEEANRQAALSTYPTRVGKELFEQQMAGRTIGMGREGMAGAISGAVGRVPGLVGNLYSQQYSHLPPEVGPYVGGLDWGTL
jgi:hypothetical protein